jgi:hypothetical protein
MVQLRKLLGEQGWFSHGDMMKFSPLNKKF